MFFSFSDFGGIYRVFPGKYPFRGEKERGKAGEEFNAKRKTATGAI
jgi:hypothetical protein